MRIQVIATHNEDFNMILLVQPDTPEDDIFDICYSELEDNGYLRYCDENGYTLHDFEWEYMDW